VSQLSWQGGNIARTLEECGVAERPAAPISMQLAIKVCPSERATWRAMGKLLRRESERLRAEVGLVDRQIIEALPKRSAQQIVSVLAELHASDPTIARTILNAALDAADPVAAGQRYIAEFHSVVNELESVDPRIARKLANATFMARAPRMKATGHFKTFARLMKRFSDDVDFVRTIATASFRARGPITAARRFIADYEAVVAALTSGGVESHVARSLAGIAGASGDLLRTALRLQRNFEAVLQFVHQAHPSVARSIAVSACRAADPFRIAQAYMTTTTPSSESLAGGTLVERIMSPQAFRSNRPLSRPASGGKLTVACGRP
jgi:hypothetical protein